MTLQQIYERLELTNKGCLIQLSDTEWEKKISLPSRVARLLKKNDLLKTMDGFFCFDNKPLILFFENPAKEQKAALHQAIWNFNESPIVISLENNAVEIFNGFAIDESTKLLKYLGGEDVLDDFSYFKLVTGKTWEEYNVQITHNSRVDYRLLENIEEAQKQLKNEGLSQKVVNALLGKIIFFRYLIDRHIILNYQEKTTWENEDLCKCLKNVNDFKLFVKYIERKFNGDMFRIDDKEFGTIGQRALNIIIRLLQSEDLSTGQLSLFDMYDFSILPIEFISNIYEKFIGKETQEKKGAYYTPTFLVDYIVSETVGKKLNESDDYNCKVLDPACGSGIFLVESLRRMIEKYMLTNNITDTNKQEFKEALKRLAVNNIFGIDEDDSAVQVAIFSVYLTLLDYQEPADLSDFKFPNLLGTNLICSDTFDVDNKDLKAFEEKKYQFDFIIGNPPWKRGGIKKSSYCELYLRQRAFLNYIGNKEIAQAFVLRSLDFATPKTQCALVVVSKVLYNLKSKKFRSYILEKLFINQVFELAPVRKEVFNKSNDSAIAPACVLFYRNAYGKVTYNNVIKHIALKPSLFFSKFKIFSLTKNDIQTIQQNKLKNFDWLWKVLVYGTYLDFIFIKRLRTSFKTIHDVINNNNFLVGQGIMVGGGDINDASFLLDRNYIKTESVERFYIHNTNLKWTTPVVHRLRDVRLYEAPVLLIREGTPKDLKLKSAINYNTSVYKSSLTGVRCFDKNEIDILRNLLGIFSSPYFAYYNMLNFSYSGIEREQANDMEKWNVPYCEGVHVAVREMEELIASSENEALQSDIIEQNISEQYKKINRLIYKNFKCSNIELDLIDYASTITIPIAMRQKGYESIFKEIKQNDIILRDYANIYINRFSDSFNRNGKRFIVEILYSSHVVGMYFKIIDESDYRGDIVYTQCDKGILSFVAGVSSEQKTNHLFVIKDIRGFERDCFYIFKPNERRLWHKAIAHLDVNEFADAMLRVGGEHE